MPGAVFTFKQLAIPRRCTLKSADSVGLLPKSADTIKMLFLCTETDYVFRLGGLGTPTAASMVFQNPEHREIIHINENPGTNPPYFVKVCRCLFLV
jgi:hypothetical protein